MKDNLSLGRTQITDDLGELLAVLPESIRTTLEQHPKLNILIEVVMDLGRYPVARFPDGAEYLSEVAITRAELQYCVDRLGSFSGDNRAGIERTLHRISCMRNRTGEIIGLTCRVGRAVYGTINMIRDLVETGKSILMLGRPGVYGILRSIPMLHLGETTYQAPRDAIPMTRSAAAAAIATCASSDAESVARGHNAATILDRLAAASRLQFTRPPANGTPGYLRLPVRIVGGMSALTCLDRATALGVAQSYPTTLARVHALTGLRVDVERTWPGAEELARDLITVPTHSLVTDVERDEIIALLR